MDFFTAKRYAEAGFHIRRATWVADVVTPLAGSSNKRVTAWLALAAGAWLYRPTNGTAERVVEADDVKITDLQAIDWTLLDAEQNPQLPPTDPPDSGPTVPPLPPVLPPKSNTVGGVSDGGAIPSRNGGDPGGGGAPGDPGGEDEPGGGGSPGGGPGAPGGNPGRPGRPFRPGRSSPSLSLNVTRTSGEACVPLLGTGAEDPAPVTDTFTADMTLGTTGDEKPGEIWMLSLVVDGKTKFSGTISAGGNQSANFSITGAAGATFPVMARAHLPLGLQQTASKNATLRPHCGNAPILTAFQFGAVINTNFEAPSSPDFDYEINPIFSASPTGLAFEWTFNVFGLGDTFAGDTSTLTIGHPINGPGLITFSLKITNAFGEATLGGTLNITG